MSAVQLTLVPEPVPVLPDLIDLRCCDVREMLRDAESRIGSDFFGADLVVADSPWGEYDQQPGVASPEGVYLCRTLDEIGEDLELAAGVCGTARLLSWHCWPLLVEGLAAVCDPGGRPTPWRRVLRPAGWRPVSGGSWSKADQQGVGHHWLGRNEPALLYVRTVGGEAPYLDRSEDCGNAYVSVPGAHSVKPEDWHAAMIRRWVPPGGLVVDLYAGLGGVARAVLAAGEGRRYLGSEIDPQRHAIAVGLTAQRRSA